MSPDIRREFLKNTRKCKRIACDNPKAMFSDHCTDHTNDGVLA